MTLIQLGFTLFMYLLGTVFVGICLLPGLSLTFIIWQNSSGLILPLRILSISLSLAATYFIYGITLICVIGLCRVIFRLKLKEGEYPYFSIGAMKWAFTNAFVLLVNVTFMDFMMLTPLNILFYRMMGAKIGNRVQINSKKLADVSLIEIGDDTVIGGDAVLICHVAERGRLKLKPVKIGSKVTVGLNSIILPGVEIGDSSIIDVCSVIRKNEKLPPKTVFSSIPAKNIRQKEK
ncbi:MAG: hypothetical protein AB1414_07685 [bacterium]